MLRVSLAFAVIVSATPMWAQSDTTDAEAEAAALAEKTQSCVYQSQVVGAVQQARLDRVKERNVKKAVLRGDVTWPAKFNAAIPLVTPWVYSLPMKDVRQNDLGQAWNELCLQQ